MGRRARRGRSRRRGTAPKPFQGEDEYGRFAWVKLNPGRRHASTSSCTRATRRTPTATASFNPAATPEIWLKSGEPTIYPSRAAAQGFVSIRYHRPDGDYDGWGLHLWGDGLADGVRHRLGEPAAARPASTTSVRTGRSRSRTPSRRSTSSCTRATRRTPMATGSLLPTQVPHAWLMSGDPTVHKTRGRGAGLRVIHYHRPDGDYGDPTSADFRDFWGMHVWTGAAAPNPSWQEPVRPAGTDAFGVFFRGPAGRRRHQPELHPAPRRHQGPGPTSRSTWPRSATRSGSCPGTPTARAPRSTCCRCWPGRASTPTSPRRRAHWVDPRRRALGPVDRPAAGATGCTTRRPAGSRSTPTGVTGGKVDPAAPDAGGVHRRAEAEVAAPGRLHAYRVRALGPGEGADAR